MSSRPLSYTTSEDSRLGMLKSSVTERGNPFEDRHRPSILAQQSLHRIFYSVNNIRARPRACASAGHKSRRSVNLRLRRSWSLAKVMDRWAETGWLPLGWSLAKVLDRWAETGWLPLGWSLAKVMDRFGCQEDCGFATDLHAVVVRIKAPTVSPTIYSTVSELTASVRWNLCLRDEDPGVDDLCWYEEDQQFDRSGQVAIEEYEIVSGDWFVMVKNDYYQLVTGAVYNASMDENPTDPLWTSCPVTPSRRALLAAPETGPSQPPAGSNERLSNVVMNLSYVPPSAKYWHRHHSNPGRRHLWNANMGCLTTCYGKNCDEWREWMNGFTCAQVDREFGCACSGQCGCEASISSTSASPLTTFLTSAPITFPTSSPSSPYSMRDGPSQLPHQPNPGSRHLSSSCGATCYSKTCDEWLAWLSGFTCPMVEAEFGCD
ncbi:hypothetical protein CYMTET_52474, partial [Cymbomonas tetramitiformis]